MTCFVALTLSVTVVDRYLGTTDIGAQLNLIRHATCSGIVLGKNESGSIADWKLWFDPTAFNNVRPWAHILFCPTTTLACLHKLLKGQWDFGILSIQSAWSRALCQLQSWFDGTPPEVSCVNHGSITTGCQPRNHWRRRPRGRMIVNPPQSIWMFMHPDKRSNPWYCLQVIRQGERDRSATFLIEHLFFLPMQLLLPTCLLLRCSKMRSIIASTRTRCRSYDKNIYDTITNI